MSRTVYTVEFKLKVVEYFLRHGGNKTFGLKTKTANHFNIDQKTVSRLTLNEDLIKKAKATINIKKAKQASKNGPSNKTKVSENLKSTNQKRQLNNKNAEKATVVDLPEDPDYSLLKPGITPSSGVGTVAHLLIKGTDEVKKAITNECELIFECKICRNLFRSVVSFLAHKRLYCQEQFSTSLQLYKDRDPETCVVVPEHPSEDDSSPPSKKRNIESIVNSLASQKDRRKLKLPSSSPLNSLHPSKADDKMFRESTVILSKIDNVKAAVLQTPVSSLRVEKQFPKSGIANLLQEIVDKKKESSDSVECETSFSPNESSTTKDYSDEQSFSCDSCLSTFTTSSLLKLHVEGKYCEERTVFTCPICSMIFLTLWGCVKHLHKVHKKKKHQRDRLRQVISSRVQKRFLTSQEIQSLKYRNGLNVPPPLSPVQNESKNHNVVANGISKKNRILALRKICHNENTSPRSPPAPQTANLCCPKCSQRFMTPSGVNSHYCIPEEPKKKIEIQIRKEYKKEPATPTSPQVSNNNAVSTMSWELQERLRKSCNLETLVCIRCDRKYQSSNILKRHVALHIGWTRFACAACPFRSYEKYICGQHCTNAHKLDAKNLNDMILEDEHFDDKHSKLGNLCIKQEVVEDHAKGQSTAIS